MMRPVVFVLLLLIGVGAFNVSPYLYPHETAVLHPLTGNYTLVFINNTASMVVDPHGTIVTGRENIGRAIDTHFLAVYSPSEEELEKISTSLVMLNKSKEPWTKKCREFMGIGIIAGYTCTPENECLSCRVVPACKYMWDGAGYAFRMNITALARDFDLLDESLEELTSLVASVPNGTTVGTHMQTMLNRTERATALISSIKKNKLLWVQTDPQSFGFCYDIPYNETAQATLLSTVRAVAEKTRHFTTRDELVAQLDRITQERLMYATTQSILASLSQNISEAEKKFVALKGMTDAMDGKINGTLFSLTIARMRADLDFARQARDRGNISQCTYYLDDFYHLLDSLTRNETFNATYQNLQQLENLQRQWDIAFLKLHLATNADEPHELASLLTLQQERKALELTLNPSLSPDKLQDLLTHYRASITNVKRITEDLKHSELRGLVTLAGYGVNLFSWTPDPLLSYTGVAVLAGLLLFGGFLILFLWYVRKGRIYLTHQTKRAWIFVFFILALFIAGMVLAIRELGVQSQKKSAESFLVDLRMKNGAVMADTASVESYLEKSALISCANRTALAAGVFLRYQPDDTKPTIIFRTGNTIRSFVEGNNLVIMGDREFYERCVIADLVQSS